MAFERHDKQWYARRPSWGRRATVNGKPAWQAAEERRAAAQSKGDAK